MRRAFWAAGFFPGILPASSAAGTPKPWIEGLKNPESVAVGADGRVCVSVIGKFDKDGDGTILVIDKDRAVLFATGLDDPKGMAVWLQWLCVADKKRIWRIDTRDPKHKPRVFAAADAFPSPPCFLNALAVDEEGTLYAGDSGRKTTRRQGDQELRSPPCCG
jgi:gluconolactonase